MNNLNIAVIIVTAFMCGLLIGFNIGFRSNVKRLWEAAVKYVKSGYVPDYIARKK